MEKGCRWIAMLEMDQRQRDEVFDRAAGAAAAETALPQDTTLIDMLSCA